MNQTINTLSDIPENRVIRIDHHRHQLSAYCEVYSTNFQFNQYDSGTRQLKKKYHISKPLNKYFAKRKFLFSKFDQGIKLDEESWFSAIPEPVSQYLCQRFKTNKIKKIFEPFSGVGGIAIHCAGQFQEYIVNDIDQKKIKMMKNNMKVYNKKQHLLSYLCSDFLQIQPFYTEAMIICPPWGGIDISQYSFKDLDEIMNPRLTDILNHAKKFCNNVMLQMPKNTNIDNLIKVIQNCEYYPLFTIEKIMTNGKNSQLFIYFGEQKFTKIQNCQLYNELYQDYGVQDKNLKKVLKKMLKEDPKKLMNQIYSKKNQRQNKHIFFE